MRKTLLLTFALLLMVASAFAVPAKTGQTKVLTLTTGGTVTATLVGDEFFHYWVDASGNRYQSAGSGLYQQIDDGAALSRGRARRAAANQERMRRLSQRRSASAGITGAKKGIIILVNFTDVAFQEGNDKALFQRIANEEGFNEAPFKGSMHDYFYDQSEGLFDLTFDVAGPVTVSHKREHYGDNDIRGDDLAPAEMVIEALKLVDNDVDFSKYDWDGDGEVDQVYVVYAGQGEADGGDASTIWPHEWNLESANKNHDGDGKQTMDGVTINTYACGSELNGDNAICGIGTMCHEFSHCLGYPDFYDTDYSGGQGMFMWDLMCNGGYNGDGYQPAGYTAYERWVAGWKTPITLSTRRTVSNMRSLQDGGETYIIYNKGNPNEYYLLENRQKTKWDESLPGNGLLITHVDYDEKVWSRNKPNDDPAHQRMTWVPADNEYQCRYVNGHRVYLESGAKGDPFPSGSVNAFNRSTKPAATLYNPNTDGSYFLDSSVEYITQNDDGTISFRFVDDGIVYKRATDISSITTGSRCIIVDDMLKVAAAGMTKKYLESEAVNEGNEGVVSLPDDSSVEVFTVTKTDGGYAFKNAGGQYLGSSKTKVLTYGDTPQYWTLAGDDEGIIMQHSTFGTICYNVQAPRFNIYTSGSSSGTTTRYAYLYVEEEAEAVQAPFISASTPFDGQTTVTITSEVDATVYYTTDGTKPTTASTAYSEPFELTTTTTVCAIAVKNGSESSVTTFTVTKNPAFTVEASHATGTYFSPFTATFTPRYGTAPYTIDIEVHNSIGVSAGRGTESVSYNVSSDGYIDVTATDGKGATFSDRYTYKLGVFSRAAIFKRVTDLSQLEAGKQVILVSKTLYTNDDDNKVYVMGREGTTDRNAVAIDDETKELPDVIHATAGHCVMLLGGGNGTWTLHDVDADAYLQAVSSTDNHLGIGQLTDDARMTVTIGEDNHSIIAFQGNSTHKYLSLTHNGNDGPRFTCFESDGKPYSYLYVESPESATEWTGTGTETDPYVIFNTTTWNLLATRVNDGTSTYSGQHFRLDYDITATEMVGASETKSFQGTFDGNGHTVTIGMTTDANECAPFRYVKNATIKRLTVKGYITTSAQFAAGIVCRAFGTTTLTACRSNVTIYASKSGDGSHGGLVAIVNHYDSNSSNISKLTLTNCLFDGALLRMEGATTKCGGFVAFNHGNTVEFNNCLFAPFDVTADMGGGTFIRTDGTGTTTFNNCYYIITFGTAQGNQGDTSSQGRDALLANLGTGWEERSLTAQECPLQPVLGTVKMKGSGTEEAPYQIDSPADWTLFVQQVNSGKSFSSEYVQLTADITVTTMAGNSTNSFSGTFLGGGHTLTVGYGTAGNPLTEQYAAPFRYVNGATVSNLTVDGSICTAAKFAAGVAASVKGTTSITNCHSDVTINSAVNGDGTHGGLAAVVEDDASLTVSSSWFTGRLLGPSTIGCGGIVGFNRASLSLTGCLFHPAELTVSNNGASTLARSFDNTMPAITTCRYTTPLGTEQGARATTTKPTGTLGVKWTGPNGTDYYIGTEVSFTTVYDLIGQAVTLDLTVTDADGSTYTTANGLTVTVSNSSGQQVALNSLNAPGTYTLTIQEAGLIAGSWGSQFTIVQALSIQGDGSKESPYQVTTTDHLQAIAALVNSGSNEFAGKYFLLMNNLEYDGTPNNYTPIGIYSNDGDYKVDYSFRGIFDGGGHTISGINIYCTGETDGDSYKALFGQLGAEGTVKNLTLASSTLTANHDIGGIVAYNEGTIENCRVNSDVTLSHVTPSNNYTDCGGIVGCDWGIVTGCVSAASITEADNAKSTCMGGIAGFSDGVITDCLYIGSTVEGDDFLGAIAGEIDGTCTTSYYKALSSNRLLAADGYDSARKEQRAFAYSASAAPVDLSDYTEKKYGNGLTVYQKDDDYVMTFEGVYYSDRLMLLSSDDNTDRIADAEATDDNYDVCLSGRTLYKDGSWNTLCLPFAMTDEQVTAQLAPTALMTLKETAFSGGTLTLDFENATTIEAGKPYIIRWGTPDSHPDTDLENPVFSGVTVSTTTNDAVGEAATFHGIYSPVSIGTDGDNTKLYLGAGNKLYWPNAAMTIGAFRAYFQLADGITAGTPNNQTTNAVRAFVLNFGDEQTGIVSLSADSKDLKDCAAWYTPGGVRLDGKPSRAGVYINNGKKVVIK